MSIIEYPPEISMELIAQDLEDGKHNATQAPALFTLALVVHDLRFELAEEKRKCEKAVRSGNYWFALSSILVFIAAFDFIHSFLR